MSKRVTVNSKELLLIFGETNSVFVNGRPVCPVSEAEVLFNVILSFKVKLLRCGHRGLPCPLFDVVVVVVLR